MSKPSWRIRRRVIWSSVIGGFTMIAVGAIGLFQDKVTGGVALVSLVASAYIGFGTLDDKYHHRADMENADG